jgi:glycosyltransferase involved in cell wall biosynthesis
MKILIVTELFPDSDTPEVTGGVENRVYYVVKRLREHHDVTVLAGGTQGGSQWRPASIASIPLRFRRMASLFWRGLHADFDVVESSILVVHPVAWILGLLKRRPVVFWYPDVLIGQWRTGAFSPLAGRIGELYERLVLKLPSARYIAISESTRRKLVAHGVAPERIDVVHCGFDPAVADAARAHAAAGAAAGAGAGAESIPSLVTASRLVPYKRVDLVVQALAKLLPEHPQLRLRIIGQGPERPRLEVLADELGVAANVDFVGYVPLHDDVLKEIAKASVFVSASEIEGFGISVVEAAAVGVPFVITDMPVFREVTRDGSGGLMFRLGDAGDLAAKIDRMLRDDELRAQCRAQAATLVESYTWAALADETAAVYRAVDAGRQR